MCRNTRLFVNKFGAAATHGEIVAEIGEHLADINGNIADWRKAHRAIASI